MKRLSVCLIPVLVSLIPLLLCGCTRPKPTPPPAAADMTRRIENSMVEGKRLDARIRNMSAEELAAALVEDSAKQLEPFNSRAYKEMITRKDSESSALKTVINTNDRKSLLPLLALRRIDSKTYASVPSSRRISILVESLRTSEWFNTWGIPHLYWEYAAKTLINEGKNAVSAISRLLDDKREAPVWGDEEVMVYRQYRYRVCDYAWALISEIRGTPITNMPKDPGQRDILINRKSN